MAKFEAGEWCEWYNGLSVKIIRVDEKGYGEFGKALYKVRDENGKEHGPIPEKELR
jgi:hypothetical protein